MKILILAAMNKEIAILNKLIDATIRHGKTLSGDFFTRDKEITYERKRNRIVAYWP